MPTVEEFYFKLMQAMVRSLLAFLPIRDRDRPTFILMSNPSSCPPTGIHKQGAFLYEN